MSDDPVRSIVETDEGALDFQDYFVRRQCKPVFRGVRFQGAEYAPHRAPVFAMRSARAQAVVITPSNPFVSIDPILALPGIRDALRRSQRPVVAVSPIVGGKAVKGPLGKMMSELGVEPSALGVARHYGRLVDGWVIDEVDRALAPSIEALGCRVKVCNTIMRTLDEKARLAQDAMELAFEMARELWDSVMDCWAIIPVKPLGAGKSRLAAVLGVEQRAALNKHLFGRVLHATLGVFKPERVAVVTADTLLLPLMRGQGASCACRTRAAA